jgi:MHS family proline/betaine transporter-like MFS transporter
MAQNRFLKTVSLISAGTAVSWYEFFLFIFWAPQINEVFLSNTLSTLDALLIFCFGYILRPLSGLIFGHIGDRFGRKPALIISVLLATLPSILIAFLPSFQDWGLISFVILQAIRLIQSVPSGSEEPGAMCYLYESAPRKKTYFASSFSFFGTQMGSIFGTITCLLMKMFFSNENLLTWGWRISFVLSAIFGLIGFVIRHKLSETLPFEHLRKEKKVLKNPVASTLFRHRRAILIAASVSIFEVVGFFIATIFPTLYFPQYFDLSIYQNFLISIFLLILASVSLPLYGHLADRYSAQKMLLISTVTSSLFAILTYHFMKEGSLSLCLTAQSLLCLSNSVLFALIPATLCHLFPTQVRYTGVGFSFNICASILGGISPIFAFFYTEIKTDPISFVGLFVLFCIIGVWLFTGARARSIFENRHELFFRCTQHKSIR